MTTALHRDPHLAPRPALPGAAARPALLRARIPLIAWLAALVLSLLLDRTAYLQLTLTDPATRQLAESKDWNRLLRVAGYWPTWLIIAIAMFLIDAGKIRAGAVIPGGWTRRGILLTVTAALSGLAAELIKLLVGRLRPEMTEGWYAFMPLADRIEHGSELGMPSSHAAVAFGAAFALSLMYCAATPILLLTALGCGLTRIMTGHHFLSDVLVAAWIAYAVSIAVWRFDARNNRNVPLGAPGCGIDGGDRSAWECAEIEPGWARRVWEGWFGHRREESRAQGRGRGEAGAGSP